MLESRVHLICWSSLVLHSSENNFFSYLSKLFKRIVISVLAITFNSIYFFRYFSSDISQFFNKIVLRDLDAYYTQHHEQFLEWSTWTGPYSFALLSDLACLVSIFTETWCTSLYHYFLMTFCCCFIFALPFAIFVYRLIIIACNIVRCACSRFCSYVPFALFVVQSASISFSCCWIVLFFISLPARRSSSTVN